MLDGDCQLDLAGHQKGTFAPPTSGTDARIIRHQAMCWIIQCLDEGVSGTSLDEGVFGASLDKDVCPAPC